MTVFDSQKSPLQCLFRLLIPFLWLRNKGGEKRTNEKILCPFSPRLACTFVVVTKEYTSSIDRAMPARMAPFVSPGSERETFEIWFSWRVIRSRDHWRSIVGKGGKKKGEKAWKPGSICSYCQNGQATSLGKSRLAMKTLAKLRAFFQLCSSTRFSRAKQRRATIIGKPKTPRWWW